MGFRLRENIRILSSLYRNSHIILNSLVLIIVIIFISGTNSMLSRSMSLNTSKAQTSGVLEIAYSHDNKKFEGTTGEVKGIKAKDSEKQIADADSQSAQVVSKKVSDEKLCTNEREKWSIKENPSISGQYVICNVTVEKMTSVSELNSAQNNYRVSHGLNTLSINGKLCEIAANRAREIANNFNHNGFSGAVESSGLGFHSYGENIASGPLSGIHFVELSWDKSPGHRENMLGDWSDSCGGVYDKYAVFLFAK